MTAVATGEVCGQVFDAVGANPSLALVFVSPDHAGLLENVAETIDAVLGPEVMIGSVAQSVVGPGREVERGPAISLWAGAVGEVAPVSFTAFDFDAGSFSTNTGPVPFGRTEVPFEPRALLLIADPFSFPAEDFLSWIDVAYPGMPVIGAMASASHSAGGNSLVLGRDVQHLGAVGALIGEGAHLEPLVSQGCRPFGRPLVVTKSERNVIYELGGRPALERLVGQARSDLTEDEIEGLATGGLQLGRVIDEHREAIRTGDFLIRGVLGTDSRSGAVLVGDVVPVGVTVQFHLARPTDSRSRSDRSGLLSAAPTQHCSSRAQVAAHDCSAVRITMPRRSSTCSARSPPEAASLRVRSDRVGHKNFSTVSPRRWPSSQTSPQAPSQAVR